jgi:hypothetical protein
MELTTSADISVMDRVKIQAQILLPLVRRLREEIGEERTNEILSGALDEAAGERIRADAQELEGTPREKFEAMLRRSAAVNAPQLEMEMLEATPDTLKFNVHACKYADLFTALGEPELGAMLLCAGDFHMAAVGAPDVQFSRSQTLMQGATHCDFCYRIKR